MSIKSVIARLQRFQLVLRFQQFMLTFSNLIRIAFLFSLHQILAALSNLLFLIGNLALMIGTQLAV